MYFLSPLVTTMIIQILIFLNCATTFRRRSSSLHYICWTSCITHAYSLCSLMFASACRYWYSHVVHCQSPLHQFFSRLKRMKTHSRSTMAQERLQGLATLCNDYDSIVDAFAAKDKQRLSGTVSLWVWHGRSHQAVMTL